MLVMAHLIVSALLSLQIRMDFYGIYDANNHQLDIVSNGVTGNQRIGQHVHDQSTSVCSYAVLLQYRLLCWKM